VTCTNACSGTNALCIQGISGSCQCQPGYSKSLADGSCYLPCLSFSDSTNLLLSTAVAAYYFQSSLSNSVVSGSPWGSFSVVGTVSYSYAGPYGQSISLANGYLSLPSTSISTLQDFTISFWINGGEISQWRWIYSQAGLSSNGLVIGTNGNQLRVSIGSFFTDASGYCTSIMTSTAYHHVVVSRIGNTVSTYLDGKLDCNYTGTASTSGQLIGTTGGLLIGKGVGKLVDVYNGNLAALFVLTSGLTASQVYSLYNLPSSACYGIDTTTQQCVSKPGATSNCPACTPTAPTNGNVGDGSATTCSSSTNSLPSGSTCTQSW
jgi:hypothetical protein